MGQYALIDVSFRESIQTNMKCSKISPFVCGNISTNYDEIADEIFRLRELRQKTTVDTAARDKQIKRVNNLQDYIAQQTTHLTEFDESLA